MSELRDVAVISAAVVRTWGHGCTALIGSRGAARALGAVGVAGLLAWVSVSYLAMARGWTRQLAGVPSDLVLLLFGALVTLCATATVVLVLVVAPERTALDSALRLLPVRASARCAGLVLPLLLVAGLLAVAAAGPAVLVGARAITQTSGALVLTLAALMLHLGHTTLVAATVYLVVKALAARVLRLRLSHAHVVAAIGTGAVSLLATAGALLPAPGAATPPALRLLVATARTATAPHHGAAVVVGWLALSVLLTCALSALLLAAAAQAGGGPSSEVVPVARRVPWPRHRFAALAWVEVLSLLRSSSVLAVLTLLAVAPLGLAVAARAAPPLATVSALVGPALLVGCSLIALHAYGLTRHHHWLYRSTTARAVVWAAPKWSATAAVWLVVLAVVAAGLALGLDVPVAGMTASAPSLLVAFAAAHLAGLLLPVSEEQPLSAAVTGLGASLLGGAGIYALGKLAAVVPWAGAPAVALGLASALFAAYRATARALDGRSA